MAQLLIGHASDAVQNNHAAIFSIRLGSSAGAFELLTRCETGHFSNKPSGAALRYSTPAWPFSQGSNCSCFSSTGILSWTSATNAFGSEMIIEQESSTSPVSPFFQRSQMPAAVNGELSRAVKYQFCFPCVVFCHS